MMSFSSTKNNTITHDYKEKGSCKNDFTSPKKKKKECSVQKNKQACTRSNSTYTNTIDFEQHLYTMEYIKK